MNLRHEAKTVCTPVCTESANLPLAEHMPAPRADPNLARVLDAWPTLPEHIRRAIVALVGTAY
jgi:hypothetical protein